MNNQESNAKKGTGMTILNIIGQCGPLLGTRLYPDRDGPFYIKGMSVCAIAMLLVLALSILLRVVLILENKKTAASDKLDNRDMVELLAGGEYTKHQRFVLML